MWNEKLKRFRKNEKKQTITISTAAGNYDTQIIIDLINQTIEDFRVKYQESSIRFENLAYLQSIENKCNLIQTLLNPSQVLLHYSYFCEACLQEPKRAALAFHNAVFI